MFENKDNVRTGKPLIPKRNNFDLLRILSTIVVVFAHAWALTGIPAFAVFWWHPDLALRVLFIISGMLVSLSLQNSRGVGDFLERRMRRIAPGYVGVVVLCALGGAFLTTLPIHDYFSLAWLKYLAANLATLNFLAPNLPGVFADHPFTEVNGSLWTIKIEVAFYLTLPLIAWFYSRIGTFTTLALVFVLSFAYSALFLYFAAAEGSDMLLRIQRQLPGQYTYFAAGALCFHYLDKIKPHAGWLALGSAAALLVVPFGSIARLAAEPIAMAVLIAWFAVGTRYLGNFGRYGDFTFGLYLWHFPLIQTFIHFDLFEGHPFITLGGLLLILLVLAYLSWHWLEKPFLAKDSHYVRAEHDDGSGKASGSPGAAGAK